MQWKTDVATPPDARMEDAIAASDANLSKMKCYARPYLTLPFLLACERLLDEAETQCASDAKSLLHVRRERLPVDAALGIRASSVNEATRIATQFLSRDIQSIVFARSRLRVEVLTTYLKEAVRRLGKNTDLVRGYRGGYLPSERREIERGLREGDIMAVVSTNALSGMAGSKARIEAI